MWPITCFTVFAFLALAQAELDCFWNGCGYKCPEATRILASRSCEDGGFTKLQRQCCRERDIVLVECVQGGCGYDCPEGTILKSSSNCVDESEPSTRYECCLNGNSFNYTCSETGCGHDCPKGAKAVATFECKDDIFEKSFQKCCLVETGKTLSGTFAFRPSVTLNLVVLLFIGTCSYC